LSITASPVNGSAPATTFAARLALVPAASCPRTLGLMMAASLTVRI